ncbi:hypothetical protein C0991_009128, partial [Blastosporella zonata]
DKQDANNNNDSNGRANDNHGNNSGSINGDGNGDQNGNNDDNGNGNGNTSNEEQNAKDNNDSHILEGGHPEDPLPPPSSANVEDDNTSPGCYGRALSSCYFFVSTFARILVGLITSNTIMCRQLIEQLCVNAHYSCCHHGFGTLAAHPLTLACKSKSIFGNHWVD